MPEKKVLLYMVETSGTKKEIGNTAAVVDLSMQEYGRVSSINVPFKTPLNEVYNQNVTYNWWAALCIQAEPTTDPDDLNPAQFKITRLNKLMNSKPDASVLCGDPAVTETVVPQPANE